MTRFLIVRADAARLLGDEELAGRATAAPRKHLKNDGRVVTEVVRPMRPVASMHPETNALFEGGARLLTLRSFLTTNAIRSTHSMTGVDWCRARTECETQKNQFRRVKEFQGVQEVQEVQGVHQVQEVQGPQV